jgi:hypothetical protein
MLVAGVAGVVGVMFLVNAVYFYRKDRRERVTWGLASGMVVEHRERHPPRGRGTSVFSPIVKFTSEKGAVVQFEDAEGQRPAKHKIGQTVPVLYERASPQSARIDTRTSWGVAAPFVLAGLIGLLVAALLVWWGLSSP